MSSLEDFMRARAMRASPDYAKYVMQTDAERATAERSHPSAVAKSFSAIQQFMTDKQRVDKAMLNQQYDRSFRAPQSLESFEQGRPQYQPPSPLEQWKLRLSAMMESGNPVLQEQAMKEMKAQAQEEVKPPTAAKMSTSAQIAVDLGYTPGTKAFIDFVRAHAMKAGSSVAIDMGNKFFTREDAQNLLGPDGLPLKSSPVGVSYEEGRRRGWKWAGVKPTSEEANSEGSTAASLDMLNQLEALVATGEADISGFKGIVTDFRNQSGVTNAAADYLLSVFTPPQNPADIEAHGLAVSLANQLLHAFRGASVGPEEKIDFIKQLPVAGQPKDVLLSNIELTKRNLETINRTKRNIRGSNAQDAPEAKSPVNPPPPIKEIPANAIKGDDGSLTWSDDTYDYMKLPNGKIKWRLNNG